MPSVRAILLTALLASAPLALAQHAVRAPAMPAAMPELSPEAAARLALLDDLTGAIVKNDAPRVAAWIRANKDVNFNFDEVYRGRTSQSPLTLAISRDRVEIARMLIEAGADVGRLDGFGRAAIHYAKSPEAVGLLSQRGADINQAERGGRNVLVTAVERGDLQTVDGLIAGGARINALPKGTDLLALAVEKKHAALVGPLLDRGVDPRKPPTRALWLLTDRGDTANALVLIRRGADVNYSDSRGETLLTRALFRKRWELAEALAAAGASLKPPDAPGCSLSCQSIQPARLATFNPGTLAMLKARGLDLDSAGSDGHTALTAIIAETPMAIRAVRAAGSAASVAQSAATGEVVRSFPREQTVTEIPAPDNAARLQALLDAGADPNVKYRAATPLVLAIALPGKPPAMVDSLLRAGGRIEADAVLVREDSARPINDDYGVRTIITSDSTVLGMNVGPLTWAVLRERGDVALRLIERDRTVGRADRHLLYFAAAIGQWDVVKAALPYAREVNAANRADVTPLMYAAEAGRADVVAALLKAGAGVNDRSANIWPPPTHREFYDQVAGAIAGHSRRYRLVGGYTALRAAREGGHAEVVRLLQEAGGRE